MILLSGGMGTRMKLNIPKQFLQIGGKPMIVHLLERVESLEEIEEIIIPSPLDYMEKTEEIILHHRFAKPIRVIEGGLSRQESVYRGLKVVSSDGVIIHEAVRPFVLTHEIRKLVQCEEPNVTYGFDLPFTVLEGTDRIEKNLERDRLINIQLPQKFDTRKLLLAHEWAAADGIHFTEDTSLYFHYHQEPIKVLRGTEYNIKITRPIDHKLGEIIYRDYVLGGE